MLNEVLEKSKFDSFFFLLTMSFSIYFLVSIIINKDFYLIKNKFFKIFLIFYLYLVFNSIFVSGEFISIKSAIPYIRFGLFVFAIFYILSKNQDKIKYLFFSILTIVLTLSIDSIFQKVFGFNFIGLKMTHSVRISSFFGDELILGSFIAKTIPLLIALTYYFNFKKRNLISIGFIIISTFPILEM